MVYTMLVEFDTEWKDDVEAEYEMQQVSMLNTNYIKWLMI
jgi:hypothetical protein